MIRLSMAYWLKTVLLSLLALWLSGCGGSSTEVTPTPAPPPVDQGPINYAGPPASTDDIQQFKISLWDNLAAADRCGGCHIQQNQSPAFARNDDINLAYSEMNPLVNLQEPDQSLLVNKVAGGHNCWLSSDQACVDILVTWIGNWANTEQQSNVIQLQAPQEKTPGASKNFPSQATLFADTVYPLLQNFCVDCHTSTATIPIAPYFASSDINEAYQAAKSKINLDDPLNSRFVLRLANEFHNCWSDCSSDAEKLRAAIQNMADQIDITQLPDNLVTSKALSLTDGTLASSGGRFENAVIAKWEFKTGSGVTAFDTSGVEPALDLTLNGDVSWVGGWGIQLQNGKAQGSTANSKKLHDLITATGEYSIEAWVVPANVTQEGPARIISYSGGTDKRNFMLGQTLYNYDHLLRTSETDGNGEPTLSTADADQRLQASLQHVVVNFDPVNGRQIYVNGEFSGDTDPVEVGNLNEWDSSFALVLGNEVSGDRPWAGNIRMVAIHNRVLTNAQIKQNFAVGVGQKFFLLFGISDIIQLPQSYVVFEVSQFDNYSYLFSSPFFISLDDSQLPQAIPLQGLRIGINGREPEVGQAFANLDLELDASHYNSESGQSLSRQGTLVALEKGAQIDEFFLTFEQLADHSDVRVDAEPPAAAVPQDLAPQARVGIRHFAEINVSMSATTGVPITNPAIQSAYNELQQQLPSVTRLGSFVAANQMAVTQLAIKYCDQLIENDNLRASFFSGFDFSQPASSAFASQDRNLLLDPLLKGMVGENLSTQPTFAELRAELNNLIDRLTQCDAGKTCDTSYTRTVAKGTCAAVLGSATLLLQ
ncbi:LamG domain-containing protein [Neptunicella sp. SCSIO 80796]|uniref:LamG domain-containing protein n=1 Tax=Neptunicella plasticusilytica TaxID=3117012 RepID=UPI003A4D2D09